VGLGYFIAVYHGLICANVKNTPSEKSGQNSPTQNIAEENL
jgi:hypothetical protein